MTKFKFRLAAALRLRQLRVEREQTILQGLLAKQQSLEKARAALEEERHSATQFVYAAGAPAAEDLRALAAFTVGYQNRARSIDETLSGVISQIVAQKHRLQIAERDERVLSKLREKKLSEWHAGIEREIEATAQELWLLSHTNNRSSPGRS